jgi:hypothetical protein
MTVLDVAVAGFIFFAMVVVWRELTTDVSGGSSASPES